MRYKWLISARPARIISSLLSLCMALCSILLLHSGVPTAHADGGAPNLAYIAGSAQGVSVIDIAQQKITRTIPLGGNPTMAYLSLDGRYLYIAQPGANKITKLVAGTGQTACSASVPGQPSLLAFDPGLNTLYVAGNATSGITAIDGDTCKIQRTIQTNGPVYGMAMAIVGPGQNGGNGNQLWFTTSSSLNILTQPDKIQTIALPGAQYITIPQGATVYVTTRQGTVVAISLQTLQVTAPLLTGGDFGPMDYDAFTQEVYIPDRAHNKVDVLTPIYYGSPIPQEPNHVITVDTEPESVAITSDGNLAFIALAGGKVEMYDILGKDVINTFSVGGSPRFIITGLYPPTVRDSSQTNANGSAVPATVLTIIAIVAIILLLGIVILLVLARRKLPRIEDYEEDEEDEG
jgi:DNA-binding beta-propeller fold protein YncE